MNVTDSRRRPEPISQSSTQQPSQPHHHQASGTTRLGPRPGVDANLDRHARRHHRATGLADPPGDSDLDIARAAEHALDRHGRLPGDDITVTVANGWITLAGQVDWVYQRLFAEAALLGVPRVRGITNGVSVRLLPTIRAGDDVRADA